MGRSVSTWSARLVAPSVLGVVTLLQIHRLDDGDTWWHLAAGRWIVDTGSIPYGDPFSYTAAGAPWLNRQWLFETVLYGSWRVLGPAGPAVLVGGIFLAAFGLLWRLARRRLPPWAAGVAVALAALAAVERFTVRPEAVTFCMLAIYLMVLDRRPGWRQVALLVGLQVVWANAHALSVLGLVPIGASLLEALAAGRRPEAARLAVAALLVGLAQAATPFGIAGALYPLYLADLIGGEQLLSHTIVEHRTTLGALAEISPIARTAWAALLAVGAVALLPAGRARAWAAIATAAAFVWLGLLARRNLALVGFGVVPLVACGLGPACSRVGHGRPWLEAGLGAVVVAGLLVAAVGVVHGGFYQTARLTRTFGLGTSLLLAPRDAVAFLDHAAPGARIFNDMIMGGLIPWESPGRRVFFDGRLQVYPDALYREYQRVLDDPGSFGALAARWNVEAAVLHHPSAGRLELAAAIARLPDWQVAYLDAGAVVLLRGAAGGVPAGLGEPVAAAWTPGVAGWLERVAAPLRGGWESATTAYQRGRAIHFLLGPPAYARARADFEAALRARPDFAAARIGLAATTR